MSQGVGRTRAQPPSLERLSIPKHVGLWPLVDLGALPEVGRVDKSLLETGLL